MRLSTRFAILLTALVPLLVLLVGLLLLGLLSHDLRADRDARLRARLSALTPMAATWAWRARAAPRIPPDFLTQRLAAAAAGADGPGGLYLGVTGADPLVVGAVPAQLPPAGTNGPADVVDGGRGWRFVAADLGRSGDARLWVFEPRERLDGQLTRLRRRLGAVMLVAAGAGAVAGFGLGRFAARPLGVLRRQARGIDQPPRSGARLATASGVTEIDELAALLNGLLDRRDAAVTRTGESLQAARAFASTVAHELRTPLTSMGTNLDLLAHPRLDPAERTEIMADLGAEHGRVLRLITMLRRLARGELLDPAAFTGTDLARTVTDAVASARDRHRTAVITLRTISELAVPGWPEGLRLVVDNLLDNAAVHGADDRGHAAITVTLTGGEAAETGPGTADAVAVLVVQDAGPGIPPADRDAVFARFRRRPGSPGSGLGLTLVRQQVALHGGTVTLTVPRDGTGTRVEVRLPVAEGAPPDRGARRAHR